MEKSKKFILRVLSDNLKNLRNDRHLSINLMADTCGISAGAFKSYLYGRNLPSVETLVLICNCYHISIGKLFGSLLDYETESATIIEILNSFGRLPSEKQGRIYGTIAPLVEKLISGNPNLERANFATRLRVCREDYGFSTGWFCKQCLIAENTLKAYEFSQRLPGIEGFIKICQTLRVSPEYMMCNAFDENYPFEFDKRFYYLTPLELSALSTTVKRLCSYFEN